MSVLPFSFTYLLTTENTYIQADIHNTFVPHSNFILLTIIIQNHSRLAWVQIHSTYLLKNQNYYIKTFANYYIFSDQKYRRYSDKNKIRKLKYEKQNYIFCDFFVLRVNFYIFFCYFFFLGEYSSILVCILEKLNGEFLLVGLLKERIDVIQLCWFFFFDM